MVPDTVARYTLTQLAGLAGVTPRTVRYYITQGLIPAPGSAGPGPKYSDADLARLRTIKRLQREHQPLAEIRAQLAKLDDATILGLAEATETPEPPQESALDYIRRVTGGRRVAEAPASLLKRVGSASYAAEAAPSFAPTAPAAPALESPAEARLERSQWERIELAPDVELHVRRPLARQTAKRVDRIVSIARDLLEEEPQ
jgi:DNA-binding transcriptional MerR regulator